MFQILQINSIGGNAWAKILFGIIKLVDWEQCFP